MTETAKVIDQVNQLIETSKPLGYRFAYVVIRGGHLRYLSPNQINHSDFILLFVDTSHPEAGTDIDVETILHANVLSAQARKLI